MADGILTSQMVKQALADHQKASVDKAVETIKGSGLLAAFDRNEGGYVTFDPSVEKNFDTFYAPYKFNLIADTGLSIASVRVRMNAHDIAFVNRRLGKPFAIREPGESSSWVQEGKHNLHEQELWHFELMEESPNDSVNVRVLSTKLAVTLATVLNDDNDPHRRRMLGYLSSHFHSLFTKC